MLIYRFAFKVTNKSFSLNKEKQSPGTNHISPSFFQVHWSAQRKTLSGITSHLLSDA